MAKLRHGCMRIFFVFVSLFVCAIISTIFNAWMKPQADATRTVEAGRGQTAIAANIATASIVALTSSNTSTATVMPSLTFMPSTIVTASYTAIPKRQIVPTNTAIVMNQATDPIVALTPTTSTSISSVVITVTNPPTVMLDPTDAQVQTVVAMSQATASIIALTPLPTETLTMTFTPTAIPTEQQEEAILRAALAFRPDEYKIVFNDNRFVWQGKIEGDRNVIITVIRDGHDEDDIAVANEILRLFGESSNLMGAKQVEESVDTAIALKILQLIGGALDSIDVDRVIVNIRKGTKESSQGIVDLHFAKKDVQEYAAGRITHEQMLARQEK